MKTQKKEFKPSEFKVLFVSGLNFGDDSSREFLVNLAADLGKMHKVAFGIIGGNALNGKALKEQLREYLEYRTPHDTESAHDEASEEEEAERTRRDFIEDRANAFANFLPSLTEPSRNDVKWHIVPALTHDRELGQAILEEVRNIRANDTRLHEGPTPRIPTLNPRFGDFRVIVPGVALWFYETISGALQRLANAFARRTFSEEPGAMLIGCTGTGCSIPRYLTDVPTVATPTLHRIVESKSTENMVGCVIVTVREYAHGKFTISALTYDFSSILTQERQFAIPENLTGLPLRALKLFARSGMGPNVLLSKINSTRKHEMKLEKLQKALDLLMRRGLIVHHKKANFYGVSKTLLQSMRIPVETYLAGARPIKTVLQGCTHVGALKGLYHTNQTVLPQLLAAHPTLIVAGDESQGISHGFHNNGELLPGQNGYDKHQKTAAKLRAGQLISALRIRWDFADIAKLPPVDRLRMSLPRIIYRHGNHDEARFGQNQFSIPLGHFDEVLRMELLRRIANFLTEKAASVSAQELLALIDSKIERVGERDVVEIDGIAVGVRHPYKGRTKNRSSRVQEAIIALLAQSKHWEEAKKRKLRFVVVANFHEACVIFMRLFGHTVVGICLPSNMSGTKFEVDIDKVVEFGISDSTLVVNGRDEILSYEVQFHTDLHPKDKSFVFKNHITTADALRRSLEVLELAGGDPISWR